jgi:hypothetical protein
MLRIAASAGMGWTACVDRYLPTQAVVLPAGLAAGFAAGLAAGFAEHAATLPPTPPTTTR